MTKRTIAAAEAELAEARAHFDQHIRLAAQQSAVDEHCRKKAERDLAAEMITSNGLRDMVHDLELQVARLEAVRDDRGATARAASDEELVSVPRRVLRPPMIYSGTTTMGEDFDRLHGRSRSPPWWHRPA